MVRVADRSELPRRTVIRRTSQNSVGAKFAEFTFFELRRAENGARSPSPIRKFCLCTVRIGDAYRRYLVHLQDRFRVTGYSNAHENSDLRQREGPSRPPSEVLAPEEDPRRFRPAERRGVAGDAPPLSERVRIPDEPVDSCDGLRGGLRRGTHRRARLGGDGAGDAFAPARGSLDAGEAVDNLPRPLVRKKKRRRDRLMEVAGADPEWAVGFLDECWWSQVALPTLNAWAEEGKPPRLIQRSVAKDDPEPKAISCYGLYLPALDRRWIRFVDGRPISSITTRFLEWSVRKLEAVGKKVLVLIWDNASWHVSKEVRRWLGSHNRRVKESGEGVRIVGCLLPKQSPWLNAIEPKWIHGKRKVVEADGLLGTYELADRVCKVFDCPHHEHLTVPQKVA